MKLRQNARHWAFKAALTAPVVGGVARSKLVDVHTGVFLDKADEACREERRERLEALFDATTDTYLAALGAGYPEAEAREITHLQANFDFYNHGWTEMMEIPVDELDPHYERYRAFFQEHGITIDDPLGEFSPPDGLPAAPATPERLDDPEHPHAEGGFADDAYVETDDGDLIVGGRDEPADVDPGDAPGVTGGDVLDAERGDVSDAERGDVSDAERGDVPDAERGDVPDVEPGTSVDTGRGDPADVER